MGFWCKRSAHTPKVDVKLNDTMCIIANTICSAPVLWLPILANIAPPDLQWAAAKYGLILKIKKHKESPLYNDTFHHPHAHLSSCRPIWQAVSPISVLSRPHAFGEEIDLAGRGRDTVQCKNMSVLEFWGIIVMGGGILSPYKTLFQPTSLTDGMKFGDRQAWSIRRCCLTQQSDNRVLTYLVTPSHWWTASAQARVSVLQPSINGSTRL